MEMPEEDAGWQIPCCGQGPCRCCPVTQGMEEAEPHFPLCVCGQHWLWHREGCCGCAQCVGVTLFLPGEMWWQWGQALGALCEQHDLTSSMLLLGTWLCHGDNRGHRALRGGDLEHLSCAAIRHKATACSALGWVRNET